MKNAGGVYMDVAWNVPGMTRSLTTAAQTAALAAAGAAEKTIEARLSQFGTKTNKVGRDMTLGWTAPFVAGAALVTKKFTTYESSISKITGLVGVSREQMAAWDDDIKRIGVDFGIGSQSAAEALYFITSSGLKGADALAALEASARASAAGLGDTETIADLVTSALNAYGPTVLSAAAATDILTVAVRDGKSEPDEMAGAMSRVLPVASAMGVSFDQVAGVMASMSLTGTDASTAATQLRGILAALLKPSKQAESALLGVGTSSAELRKQIAEEGLLPTLQTLVTTLGDDSAATAMVFDDVRALTGVMDILGVKTESTKTILADTADATGATGKAFDEVSQTSAFRLDQAMAEVNKDLIDIGANFAPIVEGAVKVGSVVTGAFVALPAPIKSVAIGLGSVLAVAGPLVWATGKISKGIGSMISVADRFVSRGLDKSISTIGMTSETAAQQNGRFSSSIGKIGQAAAGGAILIAGAAIAIEMWNNAREKSIKLAQSTGDDIFGKIQGGGIDDARRKIGTINEQIRSTNAEINTFNWNPLDIDYMKSLEDIANALHHTGEETIALVNRSEQLSHATGTSADQAFRFLGTQALAGKTFATTEEALAAYRGELDAAKKSTEGNIGAVDKQRASFAELSDAFFKTSDAQRGYRDAQRSIEDAQRRVQDSTYAVADAQRGYQDALRHIDDAQDRRIKSLRDVEAAQRAVTDAQLRLNEVLGGPSEDDQLSVEEAQIRVERARKSLREGKFDDPLDRRQAEIDLRRAEMELERTQTEVAGRAAEAQSDLTDAENELADAKNQAGDAARGLIDAQNGLDAAGRAVTKSQLEAQDAVLAVADAEADAGTSAWGLATAELALGDQYTAHQDQVQPFLDQLEDLKRKYPEVAAAMQPYIDQLRAVQAANDPMQMSAVKFAHKYLGAPLVLSESAAAQLIMDEGQKRRGMTGPISLDEAKRIIAGLADGGPARAGTPYQITERNVPELLDWGGDRFLVMPPGGPDGNVTPLAAGGRGSESMIRIDKLVIEKSNDPDRDIMTVGRELRKVAFLHGSPSTSEGW